MLNQIRLKNIAIKYFYLYIKNKGGRSYNLGSFSR